MVWDCADSIQSGQRGAAGVVSAPKGSPQAFREELEGTVRIGDREVAFTRYFDAGGCAWVEYGDGPGTFFITLVSRSDTNGRSGSTMVAQ